MLIISLSAPMQKRKRRFKGHAQSWFYQLKPSKPGEMVQVDHMTVNTSQCSVKHFQRWDPLSKYIFADVCSNATSRSAKAFLKNLIKSVPFKITSIQVDGSSEFMKEFDLALKTVKYSVDVRTAVFSEFFFVFCFAQAV